MCFLVYRYAVYIEYTEWFKPKGPKNFNPKGFSRISSTLSRKPVASRSRSHLAWCGCSLCQSGQNGQWANGNSGNPNSFARPASRRGLTRPPGQHRSPAWRTSAERLFKIKQSSPAGFDLPGCRPSKNRTADATEASMPSALKIGSRRL